MYYFLPMHKQLIMKGVKVIYLMIQFNVPVKPLLQFPALSMYLIFHYPRCWYAVLFVYTNAEVPKVGQQR